MLTTIGISTFIGYIFYKLSSRKVDKILELHELKSKRREELAKKILGERVNPDGS